jgi:Na+/melibiose symporter-like transporter
MLTAACIVMAINAFALIGARLLGFMPANGQPAVYILVLLSTGIAVLTIVTLQVVTVSILADLLDEQELHTRRRQEGVFFAASAFVMKATTGLGAMLAGIVIDVVGLTPGAEPGTIEPSVLQSLGWFSIIPTVGMAIIAAWFFHRIHMTRENLVRIKQELAKRAIT